MSNITAMSSFAYDYQLSRGYITLKYGYRVGISGDISYNRNGKEQFAKINSVCFRIAQDRMLYNPACFKKLYDKSVFNTSVISPPGCGKTTFLKNLIMHLNDNRPDMHICIADERNELTPFGLKNASIMTNCNKGKSVEYFVRCMNPDLIVFDELWYECDFESVRNAMMSGVSVVFSIHGTETGKVVFQKDYDSLLPHIKRSVKLSERLGPGTIEKLESY